MEMKDIEKKIAKLEENEKRISKLEEKENDLSLFVNKSISSIHVGIAEIKTILQERLEKENLKNDLLAKDIHSHDIRIKKIEDNQQWLWRTVVGSVLTIIVSAVIFVIKIMN